MQPAFLFYIRRSGPNYKYRTRRLIDDLAYSVIAEEFSDPAAFFSAHYDNVAPFLFCYFYYLFTRFSLFEPCLYQRPFGLCDGIDFRDILIAAAAQYIFYVLHSKKIEIPLIDRYHLNNSYPSASVSWFSVSRIQYLSILIKILSGKELTDK